ncbi:indole-3-glycerol phosphate synthase TrpC [Sinanaerobacter chloroacetimidivorans]|uniref:Indole-3-glycerol phosphate synthase n=1 Tax=Sinanaerobacter chloroacetimidivorans TaxID=2818044 RepID=A0A8J8B544_9FIRM|nr:indole-3-glycerol phosphate synthase TrpC [Sinanaerobacter chloroacetimidivorans]MBR0599980.1 indole-3-glycerol phosphate synthase TrpC [Sinanaerobacter chloroacetimidivorans]
MTDILKKIAEKTAERIEEKKRELPLAQVRAEAEALFYKSHDHKDIIGRPESQLSSILFPFENALKGEEISFICEVKKASPSKGIIDEEFPYLKIAAEYEEAGAAAISVLTEPYWFLGKDRYLTEISKEVGIPVLRKDFTIDPYQIYEAKVLGASAVLLICALLDTDRLKEYLNIAHGLGLSALVEAHREEEVDSALSAGARIIGVNNRDLKTFEVDLSASIRLRSKIPENILFISESGIKTAADIALLKASKVNGVLIGETLMRGSNKKEELFRLRGEAL